MKKKITIVTSLIVLISTLIFIFWYNGIIFLNYFDEKNYEVKGVDVSHYQGDIDWEILSNQGIKFAFIKATEGKSFVDENFNLNYKNAIKTDLKIGAYHFFTYDTDGVLQAENFIKNVSKTENMLPPVVDIEFYGEEYTVERTKEQLHLMLNKLEEFYEKKPIIYTTHETYNWYIANDFKDNYIWIRDVFFKPRLIDNREWTFWQYTNRAKLDGYNGQEKRIDINVYNGNMNDLENLSK